MATDPNARAFPKADTGHSGLTIREFAAVQIMASLACRYGIETDRGIMRNMQREVARQAIMNADTLIAALNESDNPGK
jgi:hypothetical protein